MAMENSPLLLALMDKRVKAEVIDFDHYRIRGGMAVETDFIIRIEPSVESQRNKGHDPQFESFTLSKTYSAFRTLGNQLKKAADNATSTADKLPQSLQKLVQYCETVLHLVDAQRTQYLGKVNYNYVKVLAKKRTQIIKEILDATLSYFPDELESHEFHTEIAQTIETFFLLDHCEEIGDESSHHHRHGSSSSTLSAFKTPKKYSSKQQADGNDPGKQPKQQNETSKRISFNLDKPIESVEAVGKAVGSAVDSVGNAVGNFLKQTIDKQQQHARDLMSAPPPIDTATRTAQTENPKGLTSPVVPYTRKTRRSRSMRGRDEDELNEMGEEANFLLDDDRPPTEFVPSYSHPLPSFQSRGTKLGDLLENNPIIFTLIAAASVAFLKHVSKLTVSMDCDILLLLIWAAFCIGLHTPRPMVGGIDKSTGPPPRTPTSRRGSLMGRQDRHGRRLLRMSMSMATTPDAQSTPMNGSFRGFEDIRDEEEQDEILEVLQSPMPKFPDGAELGSKFNCYSEPQPDMFRVRGPDYLSDKVKVGSQPFVFPGRGVDLFLTDTCPENAGSNGGVMGGHLREKPTFIINFRLPWGVLLAYFEIPERFVPFVEAGHDPEFDKSKLPSIDSMTPSDRCVARFLMGSSEHKNQTLKIVPMVVQGPWVVKSVVGGKPAIIGNKLPVTYWYQKADKESNKALYLEADLDIVASSAARGILSVARTYTNVLTLDLGFVVQGNSEDELPEQMLVGTRLHGIDPLTAPPYPPCKNMFEYPANPEDDDDDDDDDGSQ